MRNKFKLTREFDTEDILLVSNQVKSTRKYDVTQKLTLKKGTLKIPVEGYTKIILVTVENIPLAVVLNKHLDGADTRFTTMSEPLVNNRIKG